MDGSSLRLDGKLKHVSVAGAILGDEGVEGPSGSSGAIKDAVEYYGLVDGVEDLEVPDDELDRLLFTDITPGASDAEDEDGQGRVTLRALGVGRLIGGTCRVKDEASGIRFALRLD